MGARKLLVLCGLALTAAPAAAQPLGPSGFGQSPFAQSPFGPAYRPPVSPYLNLLQGNNSPGFNYFTQVRPQLEFRNGIRNLQQQVANNRTAISALSARDTGGVAVTGHGTTFFNTGGYFSGGAGAAQRSTANRAQTRPQSSSPQTPSTKPPSVPH
jgi:hypothetical protein